MNKLYCTDVYGEWVSCPYLPSIFWNSFQETEIIYQMMWTAMSSNSFAVVSFATATLKMKTLPTGFPVALCSTARHSNRSFLLLGIVDSVFDFFDVLDVSVSEIRQTCILHFKALYTLGIHVSSHLVLLLYQVFPSFLNLRMICCSILRTDLLRLRRY